MAKNEYPGDQLGPALRWLAGVIFVATVLILGLAFGGAGNALGLLFALPTILAAAIGCGIIAALGTICQNLAAIRRGLAGWDRVLREQGSEKGGVDDG